MKSPGFLSANVTKPRMAPSWKKRRLGTSWRICHASMFRRICRSTRSNRRWWLSGLTVQRLKGTRWCKKMEDVVNIGTYCAPNETPCIYHHIVWYPRCLGAGSPRLYKPQNSQPTEFQGWSRSGQSLGAIVGWGMKIWHKKHMGWFLVSLGNQVCLGGGIYTNKYVYIYTYILLYDNEGTNHQVGECVKWRMIFLECTRSFLFFE